MDLTSEPTMADLTTCLADGHLSLVDTRRWELIHYSDAQARFVGGGLTCPRCKTTFEHPDGGFVPGVA